MTGPLEKIVVVKAEKSGYNECRDMKEKKKTRCRKKHRITIMCLKL